MSPATHTIDRFLLDSALAGERGVARIRLILCVLVYLQFFAVTDHVARSLALEPKAVLQNIGLLAGIAFSLGSLWAARHERTRAWMVDVSAVFDAGLVTFILAPSVVWTYEGWRGVTAQPDWAFLIIATFTAGFRLSNRAVFAGAISTGLALLGILWADVAFNGADITSRADDFGTMFILWLGAGLLAIGITRRTRYLVDEGAKAAVQAERARQRLGVYVSQEIADAALEADELRPGGERRPVAVLFSDLRGFTDWGEKLDPERLIDELNAYLDAMVAVVREEGGVVDKYIGDAIMVVFGIPRTRGDEAQRALRCARRMQEALAAHNTRRVERGLRPLRHGIGVHFGDVVAGNVGTDDRLQYTVVGDVVNTASRLEGATKELHEAVLISQDLVDAVGEPAGALGLRRAGALTIRGRETPVQVLGLVDDPSAWPAREEA